MTMGLNLLVLAACLLPFGHSARIEHNEEEEEEENSPSSWLEDFEAEAQRRLQRNPLVEFPTSLTDYSVDQYLGAGSFGESWLVTSKDPGSPMYLQQVVVKLLYLKEGKYSKSPVHLTWRMAQADAWSEKGAREAARECEIAADLHAQGDKKGASGAARVMNCYGHNVPAVGQDVRGRLDMPLFLVLENCGGEDLTKFMNRKATENALSVPLVGGIFKQILEGLEFLASLSTPWVHHDLKPDNVVVKSNKDGSYSAYLIDLGATVKATQAFMCQFTACTPVYAPSEWGNYKSIFCPQQNFEWSLACPDCGTAFDMFSASAILVELVTGSRLYKLAGSWNHIGGEFKYGVLDSYAKHPENIDTAHIATGDIDSYATSQVYGNLMAGFLKEGSTSADFFAAAMAALHKDASRRPTAAKLLKHAFFGEAKVVVYAPASIVVVAKCPFKAGEAVEVYYPSKGGYVQAIVTSVTGNKVKVQITEMVQILGAAPGQMAPKYTIYRHDCMSSLLRKLPTQKKQAPTIPQGGYRPALGGQLPGFDDVKRVSEDSSCPVLCTQCATYNSLSSHQFVCWSPTRFNSPQAAKWLYDNDCDSQSTYSKTSFGRPYFGYVCAK